MQETEYTELSPFIVGVLEHSVLGPLLYLLYTADLSTSEESTTAIIAVIAMDNDPGIVSRKLQTNCSQYFVLLVLITNIIL
jgi:hypothetical protein